jgi:tRNA-specific 2-thiouridylase
MKPRAIEQLIQTAMEQMESIDARNTRKVLMAMSGGVDSSVAAALLVHAGYDVTGVFMINYEYETSGHGECWRPEYQDAMRVAAKLGIPLLKWNFVKEYQRDVLDHMIASYEAGRTPNPDVRCNSHVKYGAWLTRAQAHGFDILATGHYAQEYLENGQWHLGTAVDDGKDQTYFLHQLSQEQLAHAHFPLGGLFKAEIRRLAEHFALPTAQKKESMGICFVGDISIEGFLRDHSTHVPVPGPILLDETGETIGEHHGLLHYTIGQRQGIPQAGGTKPLFVLKKDLNTHTLVVGYDDNPKRLSTEVHIEAMHLVHNVSEQSVPCLVRMRHRQTPEHATLHVVAQGKPATLVFDTPQAFVTPGQYAVCYDEDMSECLGGGVIV